MKGTLLWVKSELSAMQMDNLYWREMPQLTQGLKLGTSCKTGEKISRAAVVHLFMCTQTLVIVQAVIFQVSQWLIVFFLQCFFNLGEIKMTCRTAHGPPLHCFQQSTASRSGSKLQVWSSVVGQEHRHTPLVGTTYLSSHLFFFFPALFKKKKNYHLGNTAFLNTDRKNAC